MIREGTQVCWKWGSSKPEGKVVERYTEPTTKHIDGTEVTRNGSDDDPALLIQQDDGQRVLKLHSEVERADDA